MDSENNEILNFIDSKSKEGTTNLDSKQIFFIYMQTIINSLKNTYCELNNINNSIIAKNLIMSIFWIFISYTNNVKLIMFMSDRAVLLFNEYIKVSKSYQIENINITEIKTFIINKTIGPLHLKNYNKEYSELFEICYQIDNLFTRLFTSLENEFKNHANNIYPIVGNVIYKLYMKDRKNISFIKDSIDNILENGIENIIYNVNMFKINGESLLNDKNEIDLDEDLELDIKNNYLNPDEPFNIKNLILN